MSEIQKRPAKPTKKTYYVSVTSDAGWLGYLYAEVFVPNDMSAEHVGLIVANVLKALDIVDAFAPDKDLMIGELPTAEEAVVLHAEGKVTDGELKDLIETPRWTLLQHRPPNAVHVDATMADDSMPSVCFWSMPLAERHPIDASDADERGPG